MHSLNVWDGIKITNFESTSLIYITAWEIICIKLNSNGLRAHHTNPIVEVTQNTNNGLGQITIIIQIEVIHKIKYRYHNYDIIPSNHSYNYIP